MTASAEREWFMANTHPVSEDEFAKAVRKAIKFGSGSRDERVYPFVMALQWQYGWSRQKALDYIENLIKEIA